MSKTKPPKEVWFAVYPDGSLGPHGPNELGVKLVAVYNHPTGPWDYARYVLATTRQKTPKQRKSRLASGGMSKRSPTVVRCHEQVNHARDD